MDVQVILTQDDPKLGERGKVVKVSPGFAFNYLIPHRKASVATPAAIREWERRGEKLRRNDAAKLEALNALAEKIRSSSLTLEVMAGEEDKLFGAVTAQDVVSSLADQGISVEKKAVHLEEPIRRLGAYTVPVRLHPSVTADLKIWVVKKKK